MNGTAYSNFDNQEHVLKLGETFEKHPKSAYHTVRCKWHFKYIITWQANVSFLVSHAVALFGSFGTSLLFAISRTNETDFNFRVIVRKFNNSRLFCLSNQQSMPHLSAKTLAMQW